MRTNYRLPEVMRYSTLAERAHYYRNEFDFSSVNDWLGTSRDPFKTVYAAVIGRHTHVFKKKYSASISAPILIDEYEGESDITAMLVELCPEGAYYDRNRYSDIAKCAKCCKPKIFCWGCKHFLGQELCFDIDPENINCPIHGGLAERLKEKQGLGFCETELRMARDQAVSLFELLKGEFSSVLPVYSGRGYHLHVFDEAGFYMGRADRLKLAKRLIKSGFAIDEWVTEGTSRLIRLPYSLHGMVSRVVLPLGQDGLKKFDPVTDARCIPKFAKKG